MVVALVVCAVVAFVALSAQAIMFARTIASMGRRHDRHVDQLLDRLAHAHGRTWTPPPADPVSDELAAIVAERHQESVGYLDPDQEV